MNESDLPDWSFRLEHLKRSIRYSGDVDILPEWANEAYADPDSAVFDSGKLWGASAWKSNEIDVKYYEQK